MTCELSLTFVESEAQRENANVRVRHSSVGKRLTILSRPDPTGIPLFHWERIINVWRSFVFLFARLKSLLLQNTRPSKFVQSEFNGISFWVKRSWTLTFAILLLGFEKLFDVLYGEVGYAITRDGERERERKEKKINGANGDCRSGGAISLRQKFRGLSAFPSLARSLNVSHNGVSCQLNRVETDRARGSTDGPSTRVKSMLYGLG